jgi:hypothetical protein
MATTPKGATKPKSKGAPLSEETVSWVRELNQKPIQLAKKSGRAYLDTYEKALQRALDFEKAAASRSPLNWVTALADTHTKFVHGVTSQYIKAARDVLK